MAKTEKKAAAKSSIAKASRVPEAPASSNLKTIVIGAAVVAALAAGIIYWRSGSDAGPVQKGEQKDVPVSELMAPGPLEDITLGQADAPNTIVEYASMTCGHCARFHTTVLPELEKKYIETGQARLILREFPLDSLATAAFMLARCAGNDRYYPMVSALFETQQSWAVQGGDGKEKLLAIARQAGFSKEKFDQCLADKDLFDKIVETRKRADEQFGVNSTPTFFINGKRLRGGQDIKEFETIFAGGEAPEEAPHDDGH